MTKGVTLPWGKRHPFRMHEARFSLQELKEETGIGIDEVNRRVVDYGVQKCFASHEPWIIPEPFTPEPPETLPKEGLDKFAEVFRRIVNEAYTNPEIFKLAPYNCAIGRMNTAPMTDPRKWAMTWRAYIRKNG